MRNNFNKIKLIEIVRWILIFPCVVIIFLILHSLFGLLCSLFWTNENPNFFRFITPILLSGPSIYIAIVFGIEIAPSHRNYTSLAFIILCSIFIGIALILYCFNKATIDSLLEILGMLIGSVAVYAKLYKGEELI